MVAYLALPSDMLACVGCIDERCAHNTNKKKLEISNIMGIYVTKI